MLTFVAPAVQGWARKRLAEGWTWGPRVDDRAMRHNCLVPFDFLTEPEKDMERAGVTETVKIIIGLGFMFVKDPVAGTGAGDPGRSGEGHTSPLPADLDIRQRRGSQTQPTASLPLRAATAADVTAARTRALPSVTPLGQASRSGVGVGGVSATHDRPGPDAVLGSRASDIVSKLQRIERAVDVLSQTSNADLSALGDKVDALQTMLVTSELIQTESVLRS